MGDKNVSTQTSGKQFRAFTKAVLNDLHALEKMLAGEYFEENVRRIGAEQEMFIVDSSMNAAPLAVEIINAAKDERLTTELGLFNLEANTAPLDFTKDCLSKMERELNEVVNLVKKTAQKFDAGIVLAGILPTLKESDYVAENLTPEPRYIEMDRVLTELHGKDRFIHIKGLDELQLKKQNTFIEFSNVSFQIHLQVGIGEFANAYNWSQAIAAPVLASAVNSPFLLGHRLWHETRIALFQHATDARSTAHKERSQMPRVHFGDDWINDSILEMFHEDLARFRFILTRQTEEDALAELEKGKVPNLEAWQMHNGTIWRWNRTCYGILNKKPSLRIEARFLPAGPTILDEVANSAFFLGLMTALPEEFGDVRKKMSFDDAKMNFFNVAQNGLKTQIVWLNGKSFPAKKLILEKLLPLAEKGLLSVKIRKADIKKYLGVIEERVKNECTGAQWMLDSYAAMDETAQPNVRLRTLVAAMKSNQETNEPLHKWQLAEIAEQTDWIDNFKTVEQFMSKDFFTVRPEDVIDLAASLMNWKSAKHIPVEDDKGNLVGIITHTDLLKIFPTDQKKKNKEVIVSDIMTEKIITVAPNTPTLDALNLMRKNAVGCLPVVKNKKLVGLLTSQDFLSVSTKLFEERLQNL